MKCDVCGLEHGVSRNCPGPLSAAGQENLTAGEKARTDGGVSYYLGEAVKIVRWDDTALRRNARDPRATPYALLVWMTAALVILLVSSWSGLSRALPRGNPVAFVIGAEVGLGFGLIVVAIITFVQLGLCHLIAKWLFGATGRFRELMRPLLLGWFVNCLAVIPVAGALLAAIGWTAVLMMVFEEVDEIERLQAFGISAGINVCFLILQIWLMPGTHIWAREFRASARVSFQLEAAVAVPKHVGDEAAEKNSGAEEVAPFGDADQADDQNAYDNNEACRVARPNSRTEFAVGDDFPRTAIFIGARYHLIERVATKRNIGFHGVTLLS